MLNVGPANAASFTLNPDGSFNYTPALNFNGTDSFTYHAFDGAQSSGIVTATITVNPINDAPDLTGFGDTPTFVENGSSVILDTNADAAVSDVELDASPNKYDGTTLIIDYPEKIIPAGEGGGSSEERMALVTLLKWASSQDIRRLDVGVILVTESAQELHADLLRNPHVGRA